jgi:antitoxin ParD1/3/4
MHGENIMIATNAEKLSITLPPEMAQMIRDKVSSGSYSSNSEVIRDALRLLQEKDFLKVQKLAALREKVERSINDDRPSIDGDDAFARLEARHKNRMSESNIK